MSWDRFDCHISRTAIRRKKFWSSLETSLHNHQEFQRSSAKMELYLALLTLFSRAPRRVCRRSTQEINESPDVAEWNIVGKFSWLAVEILCCDGRYGSSWLIISCTCGDLYYIKCISNVLHFQFRNILWKIITCHFTLSTLYGNQGNESQRLRTDGTERRAPKSRID